MTPSHDMLCGHPVVAILQPGDIVVLECEKPLDAGHMNAIGQMLKAWAEKHGVAVLLLPHPVKVARVVMPRAKLDQSALDSP